MWWLLLSMAEHCMFQHQFFPRERLTKARWIAMLSHTLAGTYQRLGWTLQDWQQPSVSHSHVSTKTMLISAFSYTLLLPRCQSCISEGTQRAEVLPLSHLFPSEHSITPVFHMMKHQFPCLLKEKSDVVAKSLSCARFAGELLPLLSFLLIATGTWCPSSPCWGPVPTGMWACLLRTSAPRTVAGFRKSCRI